MTAILCWAAKNSLRGTPATSRDVTNQTLPGRDFLKIKLVPSRESLVSDIPPLGTGKSLIFFYSVSAGLSKRTSDKKKGKSCESFPFYRLDFRQSLFHRVENPASYQFICEGRHVAEPRNHGNHSWLVPRHGQNHRSYPYFL